MGYPTRIVLEGQNLNIVRFQCSVCADLLKNPHQDQCGHRICLECYQSRTEANLPPCLNCEEEGITEIYPIDPSFQPNPDYAIKREMSKMRVRCVNEGCPWEDHFKNLQPHLETCHFGACNAPVCPICHDKLPSDATLNDHVEGSICKHLVHFNDTLLSALMQNHFVYEKLKEVPRVGALREQVRELREEVVRCKELNQALEESLSLQALTTYDGTLLWRVGDFGEKMRAAEDGECTSIYSPYFYTHRYGFKARLRLYLNGDGATRGTHISLFLVIVKGEYDALLEWPFQHTVSFWLLDQTPAKDHTTAAFKPDSSSSSFQRPTSDMNLPTGMPKFLSLTNFREGFERFVVDDTAFVKVLVHEE